MATTKCNFCDMGMKPERRHGRYVHRFRPSQMEQGSSEGKEIVCTNPEYQHTAEKWF